MESREPEVQPQARCGRNDKRKGRSLDTYCFLIKRSEQEQATGRMFGVPLELAEAE